MNVSKEVISNVLEPHVIESYKVEPVILQSQTMFEWLVENGQAFEN
jgi:hypothetical protein